MGNRKKIKNNRLRLKKFSKEGLARALHEDRPHIPTHDELMSNPDLLARLGAPVEMVLNVPDDEAEVIKVVPAKVDGVVVGEAYLHDDGTVAIKYNADAPQDKLDKIRATAAEVGYSLETGD